MAEAFSVLNVHGPYREPREQVFSFDYVVLRPDWASPQAVRVQIAIIEELEQLKTSVLNISGGTPGQQLKTNQILCRAIADQKLQIADEEKMFDERRDVLVGPFSGPLAHLFDRLESWMKSESERLRNEVKTRAGL